MKKINLILIIIVLMLIAGSIGFLIGAFISNPKQLDNNNFLANCEENTLNKIEARLKKIPALFAQPIETTSKTKIPGQIKNIYQNQILLTKDQVTLHDLIWDIDQDIRINITENTKIYFKQTKPFTEIQNIEQILPDGNTINLPGDRFENINVNFDELKKQDKLIILISEEDFEEKIINALEIILIK